MIEYWIQVSRVAKEWPTQIKLTTQITEGLNDADCSLGHDRQIKPTIHTLKGTSKNPNSVAMLRCCVAALLKNFNSYISNICGALKF